ncbi:putative aldehyde dehydrogenase [Nocardia neocaledoniensis NBRC 108232]|uniref:Aldehyde dehydrogenase (NAD(P)+) n=1 Tax=Nocardia neocaledoniensis TaxID=236511 RepID=A0A317NXR0_9NOCA|nr:aldehyde dehydrogenase family protein [Nocardia neocaledoniensis]PWV78954.1 aldehyde dehydrogenase (NAD(P)+) [Nocardia neocaledoniensis]GEM35132.1 putative aldehyde dehydrogenase [Nocardia neocaledoniensis NBRC 108232]
MVTKKADPALDAVDAALSDLVEGERKWAATSLRERRWLLDRVRELTGRHAQDWVDAAAGIKGLPASSPLVGEEWISGPYVMAAALGALANTLEALARGESPLDKARFGVAGDRVTVDVLPANAFDALLLNGFSAQVWLRRGISSAAAKAEAGLAQRDPARTNGIGAVLGAGNITSIAPLDVLYELIAHNRVVALKLNPITDPMLPVFAAILAPLIELGAVRLLTGGAEVGGHLVGNDLVDHVHMTGSARTHDAIVWGTGAEAAERRRAGTPKLTKPVTSELGGVSPTIVLPGEWSEADIAFQAEHVATQRLHNGGYNCVASQALILSADWPQKEQFLAAVRAAFAKAPARPAYYPGSDERVAGARTSYPGAERLGTNGERLLVTGIAPSPAEPLLAEEYFAPVFGVVEIPGTGAEFARAATRTANDAFAGTLGVNVIAKPETIDELGAAFDLMVEDLRYGTVAINAWTGVGYLTPTASWGAFPGHTIEDVQSGIGVVHNAWLIDGVERTVVRGPFRPAPRSLLRGELALSPKPPWFVGNKTAASTGRLLAGFAADPGWLRLPAIFASALRG